MLSNTALETDALLRPFASEQSAAQRNRLGSFRLFPRTQFNNALVLSYLVTEDLIDSQTSHIKVMN